MIEIINVWFELVAREMKKKVVSTCPVCNGELVIRRLGCGGCGTGIETELPVPAFFRLPEDLQEFVMVFLRCRGNIREVEKVLGISYPTVCKRLDMVNVMLGNVSKGEAAGGTATSPAEVLERLERGEITAKEAAQMLKGRSS